MIFGTSILVGFLGACSSGDAFDALKDTVSVQTASLVGVSLDSNTRQTATLTGEFDRAANSLSFGALSGVIDQSRSTVSLDGGGLITIQPGANEYSSRYVATPFAGNRTTGVLGIVTPVGNLPTGIAVFNGTSVVTIQDGTSLFDLAGSAEVVVDFGSEYVTTTLSELSGTMTSGLTAPSSVTNVATITIEGSRIDAAAFDGGVASIASDQLSALGENAASSLNGTFFGETGQEVGGVIVLDDTTEGNLRIFGDFLGN